MVREAHYVWGERPLRPVLVGTDLVRGPLRGLEKKSTEMLLECKYHPSDEFIFKIAFIFFELQQFEYFFVVFSDNLSWVLDLAISYCV